MAHAMGNAHTRGEMGRRRAVTAGILGLGGLIGLAYTALAVRFIFPDNKGSAEAANAATGGLQEVGAVDTFKPDNPVLVQYKESTGIPTGVFIVAKGGDKFDAFDFHCTHLQCPITGTPTGFACPCHGSVFNIDGTVKAGPAPAPLQKHIVKVQDGKVLIGGLA